MSKLTTREVSDPLELKLRDSPDEVKFKSGHFELEELMLGKLVHHLDKIEFTDVVTLADKYSTITLTQSLSDSNMVLIIGVGDGLRIFERLGEKGLQGEEFVKLKLYSPGRQSTDTIDLLFHVMYIESVTSNNENTGLYYNLVCVTKEKIISDLSSISRSFDKPESEVAKNIFNNEIIGSKTYKMLKQVNPSKGSPIWAPRSISVHESINLNVHSDPYIIPSLQPIDAIQWLAYRAIGPTYTSGSYYSFFETPRGFYFANIEEFVRGHSNLGAHFTYDPLAVTAPPFHSSYYRNIQWMSPMTMPSPSERMNDGTFTHTVTTVDYCKKRHIKNDFNMYDHQSNRRTKFAVTGNEFPVTESFFNTFATHPIDFMIVKNRATEQDMVEHVVAKTPAYKNLLSSYIMDIGVYGDTSINAGDVIHIDLPESGAYEQRMFSMYSGLWFVVSVKHIIDNGKMNTVLSIVKGSLEFTHDDDVVRSA